MEARAVAKYVRMSTRKARLVIDAIRGKNVNDALRIVQLSRWNQPLRMPRIILTLT